MTLKYTSTVLEFVTKVYTMPITEAGARLGWTSRQMKETIQYTDESHTEIKTVSKEYYYVSEYTGNKHKYSSTFNIIK